MFGPGLTAVRAVRGRLLAHAGTDGCPSRCLSWSGSANGEGDRYASAMELLAAGRMAEVFVIDDERVVKLDREEWDGVSAFESDVLGLVGDAGIPVARSHGVVTVDGRCGVLLDRLYGRSLLQVVIETAEAEIDPLAEQFARLQAMINATVIEGLPDLMGRLKGEIEQSGLRSPLIGELADLIVHLDDGARGVCHYDLHPDNVIVTAAGWVVIDWLTVASGPPVADLARTLLLGFQIADPQVVEFTREVRRHGLRQRDVDEAACDAWIRVAAAARLAEGFSGETAAWLRSVAEGAVRLSI
jgi:Phosphotransferase enzyme family